jgi:hypothetical protein
MGGAVQAEVRSSMALTFLKDTPTIYGLGKAAGRASMLKRED